MTPGSTMPEVREASPAYLVTQTLVLSRISLLDVNVLIALCDGRHQHHELAARWFVAHAAEGWASCPLTQNGLCASWAPRPTRARDPWCRCWRRCRPCVPGHHHFWPDALSLLQPGTLNTTHLLGHRQLSDAYLLALAVHHQGRLVTLEGGLTVRAVQGAAASHLVRLLP